MKIGTKEVQFREGFKPKSFSEFSKVFAALTGATEVELKDAYKKLNGNTKKSSRVVKKDQSGEHSE